MSLGTGRLTSRKVMRVATLFTGVASAGAFAAPANAQAAANFTPRTELGVQQYAATREGSCGLGESHWLTFFRITDLGGGDFMNTSTCFGGMGSKKNIYVSASGFCGGNNVGFFSGHTASGKHLTDQRFHQSSAEYEFKPPKFPHDIFYVSRVYISAFTGNEMCG